MDKPRTCQTRGSDRCAALRSEERSSRRSSTLKTETEKLWGEERGWETVEIEKNVYNIRNQSVGTSKTDEDIIEWGTGKRKRERGEEGNNGNININIINIKALIIDNVLYWSNGQRIEDAGREVFLVFQGFWVPEVPFEPFNLRYDSYDTCLRLSGLNLQFFTRSQIFTGIGVRDKYISVTDSPSYEGYDILPAEICTCHACRLPLANHVDDPHASKDGRTEDWGLGTEWRQRYPPDDEPMTTNGSIKFEVWIWIWNWIWNWIWIWIWIWAQLSSYMLTRVLGHDWWFILCSLSSLCYSDGTQACRNLTLYLFYQCLKIPEWRFGPQLMRYRYSI